MYYSLYVLNKMLYYGSLLEIWIKYRSQQIFSGLGYWLSKCKSVLAHS